MAGSPGSSAQIDPVRAAFRGFLLDIALNAFFPLLLYRLSKRYLSPSEFTALIVATTFPLGKSIFDVARRRRLDPVSVIVLLGIGASAIALLAGGSPRLLLMRESFFTAIFGLACFGSLLLPRPMMFYFGRHFMAGGKAVKRRRYEAGCVGQRLSGRVRDPRCPDFARSRELGAGDLSSASGLAHAGYDRVDVPLCEVSARTRDSADR